jgi:uncharacterized membrane protein
MSALFAVVVVALKLRQHAAFNTRVYDFARFAQALWTTVHGRFLFSSLHYGSILGNHFSPLMAAWSPLMAIWADERLLFLIQAVNVAAAGLILHRAFKTAAPRAATWALLLFYLNPALHRLALFEVRRIVFGMPFLALALYGLVARRRWVLLLGISVAMMAKESVALYAVMIGLFLLIVERDGAWGAGVLVLGATWLVGVSLWAIPAIRTAGDEIGTYPQLYYFDHLGSSYGEILRTLVRDPMAVIAKLPLREEALALLRLLLPFGVVMPFLAPKLALLCAPYVGLMFLSSDVDMIRLDKWYPTTILPVLFTAAVVGWARLPARRQRWALIGWTAAALLGFGLYSTAPLGGRFDPERYRVTDRDRLAAQVIDAVPSGVAVAANPAYVPHLVTRTDVYHYPIVPIGEEAIDVFVFDRQADVYLISQAQLNARIDRMVADPKVYVDAEADGLYAFRTSGAPPPAFDVDRAARDAVQLDRVEVAIRGARTPYRTTATAPIAAAPGDRVRVFLYWEAVGAPDANLSVSVRIAGAGGALVAQHDQTPGAGDRPTLLWEPGLAFRDVYTMTIPPDAPPGPASLDLVLYESGSLEVVPFEGAGPVLHVAPVVIGSGAEDEAAF